MVTRFEYRVPSEKMDLALANLDQMYGYLNGMIEYGKVPLYAQDDLKGYLHEARAALRGLDVMAVQS